MHLRTSDEEASYLRQSLNDLVALTALPAIWKGRDADFVARTLVDAVSSMLRADVVSAVLFTPTGNQSVVFRPADALDLPWDELQATLCEFAEHETSALGRVAVAAVEFAVACAPIGFEREYGVLVVASRQPDFPNDSARLLMSIAANQTAVALQGARRLDELAKLNRQLDDRVAVRTAELAAANEALKLSERAAREIVDNFPSLIGILNASGGVEQSNRRILEYTGKSVEELEKWGMSDLVHPDDLPQAIECFTSGIEAGEPFSILYRMRRHDGVYCWFEGLHSPLKDEGGRVKRWCVSCTNIDDRRRVEEALRETERAWRSVINGIPGLTATLSPTGEIEAVSPQIVDYTGCELATLVHWGTNGIVHPGDMAHVGDVFGRSISEGVPYEIEQRLRRADGEYRWFSNRGMPALDADGKVLRWYVLLVDIHDARLVADALRQSEENSRAIVDTIAGMVAVFSPDGQLIGGNQQLVEYFQQPVPEIGRWAENGMTHPADLQHCVDTFMGSIASGQPYHFETRFRRHDGVFRWFEIRGSPLYDAEGKISRWFGLLTDIDDQKRAEEAVAASERNLQVTVDSIPALVWSARSDGTADFFNRHYLEYVGHSREELSDWNWTSTIHPDDVQDLRAAWDRASTSGESAEYEGRIRGADGRYRWFLFRSQALLDDAGNVVKWYGINTDIEDRKQTEERLRRSEASLADAQRLSAIGNFTWKLATGEITFSDELYRIFEFDLGEPITLEAIGSRVDPDDVSLLSDKIALAFAGRLDHEYDIRLRMEDGRTKYLHSAASAGTAEDGSTIFRGTIQDVTQRRLAEEALSELRIELAHVSRVSTLGAMTASIAHEVNQPLAGIITNANTCVRMLSAEPPNVTGAREATRRMIRDGNRAAEVIHRLRALFRKRTETSDKLDLNEAARDVIALAATELRRSKVELETTFSESLPLIVGDRIQLQQVILNLLLNAADAVQNIQDKSRRVSLETAQDEDGSVTLTVRDTGIGIEADSLKRVFDPFYTTKAGGMGIGLSVSRSIIEHHGGRIWASQNPGPGVSVSFAVPTAPKQPGGGDGAPALA